MEARELVAVQQQVVMTYKEYDNDHFIFPRYLSSLLHPASYNNNLI
jgi:hypothetical protein